MSYEDLATFTYIPCAATTVGTHSSKTESVELADKLYCNLYRCFDAITLSSTHNNVPSGNRRGKPNCRLALPQRNFLKAGDFSLSSMTNCLIRNLETAVVGGNKRRKLLAADQSKPGTTLLILLRSRTTLPCS